MAGRRRRTSRRPWPTSTRTRATAGSTSCSSGCRPVWDSMRLDLEDESRGGRPVSISRADRGQRQRQHDAGHRGAVPVPAPAAPPAAAADGLRHLDADRRSGSSSTTSALLPGRHPEPRPRPAARCVSVGDSSPRPLSEKLLERPRLLREDRRADPQPGAQPPDPLQHDRARARRRADPRHPDVRRRPAPRPSSARKTGCRRLFDEVGVPHPLGAEDLHSLDEVVDGDAWRCCTARPTMAEAIVKLNDGVSGAGNALVDLRGLADLADAGASAPRSPSGSRRMQLEAHDVPLDAYLGQVRERTAESSRSASSARSSLSPSVQLRVLPDGDGRAAVHARPAARRRRAARATSAACSRPTRRTRG